MRARTPRTSAERAMEEHLERAQAMERGEV